MLLNDFFYIRSLQNEADTLEVQLELNPAHHIFEGHFPGQPVVPGVCMVQMIKEILEQTLEKRVQLEQADYIKFLSVIDPRVNASLSAEISLQYTSNGVAVNAVLRKETVISLKLRGNFVFKQAVA